ncbi:bifunctional DNA primase/polymerase [Acidiplasma cupricumulans]|uniref:SF3 helicase domain-containing protein n=1 Tax=Acidiplasma cupricumulans TaxID=312540 RepID=A0A0Q0XKZ4_9ARCH|nr:bifunctional DNA primase/polymerase [Acidiplasma cupricumulans]KQB35903.1 hypothetical protein AOG55_05430 [Acidiplasma cupricumulans]
MTNEILEAAKKYCENHIFIFPVGKNKVPHTIHGLKDATNDYNQFLKLYKPGDQIAILTGAINNLYVIDCDVEKDNNHRPVIKDGKIINTGEQNFISQFINKNNAEKFKTKTIKTQSGGKQLYYKLRNNQVSLKTHIGILQKVDLKGDGGYVVAPPSEGQYGKYKIIVDAPISIMPDELYNYLYELDMSDDSNETIVPINFNDSTLSLLIKTVSDIFKHPNGKGNEMLMAFSGAMALRNISIEHTKEIIKEAANLNKWPDVNYSVIDNSYNKAKNNKKVLGYTTFKNDVISNKDQYENFDEIIKNLELIFEHYESPFYDIDGHNVKHFNKEKSIKFVMSKYTNLFTDEFENLYHFSDLDGWHTDVENEIKKFIQITDNSISEHNINEIIAGIKHITYSKEFKNKKLPNTLIPIPSGLYNVETKKLEPHNKNFFYKNIERKYISEANQLAFDCFLNKILVNPKKDKRTVYESLAWCLLNDNNIQGMVIFYGEGGNGKGIIQNDVISNLLGRENVAMPDLNRIANYPFELQSIANKKALLFSESVKGVTYNWEILKRITGHDYENIPIKNKPSILSQYQSAVILSTNQLIPPKDELAIWRRIINIVEFNNFLNTLNPDEIAKIMAQLSNPSELDALFSFIIDKIYPEFIKHGFTHRYNIKTAKERYLMKSNPAITYLKLKEAKDEILIDPDDVLNYCKKHGLDENNCISANRDGTVTVFEIKSALIKQVNQFCKANHLPKYDEQDRNSQTKLGQAIHYLDLEVSEFRKRINGKPIHAWSGIFVTPDDEDLKIDDNDDRNPENSALDNDNKGHNFDLNSLPEGPVKQSLIEEHEQKEFEKQKEQQNEDNKNAGNSENKDSEKAKEGNEGNNENNKGNPENIIMPKGKAHYYQVLKNFNKYDYSFFYGSDISCNSSKIIPKKGSSETSYVLLKLIIPDKLNKTPKGWGLFLADSQEISETDFNILSRGDSQ